ncbi:MAG: esterase [Ignavibacteria bacterium]|nr:esterase [Ignavibacteria bacterium]
MILYLHGFASSGMAAKALILREHVIKENTIKNKIVISPDLPAEPAKAMEDISKLLKESREKTLIFGSSLGGFYALYASQKFNLPCVLINPAIIPHVSMESVLGVNKNYKTNEEFEFTEEYLLQLEKMYNEIYISEIKGQDTVLLLAKDDRILDYRKTLAYFGGHYGLLILENEAGHEFSKFGKVLPKVFEYYKNQ